MTETEQYEINEIEFERVAGAIPEGTHLLYIESVEMRPGGSGYPYLNLTMLCLSWNESKIWGMVSLAPAARFKFEEFLDAVGAPKGGKMDLKMFIKSIVGKKVRGVIKSEEYEGKSRPKIQTWLTAEGDISVDSEAPKKEKNPSFKNIGKRKVENEPAIPEDVLE